MLNKSKKSALVLSCIAVLSFSITGALLYLLIPYLISGDVRVLVENPGALDSPGEIAALTAVIAALLLVLIGIGAFWLYRFFGERYYGGRGALRWALFGALFALLLKLPDWLLPQRLRLLGDLLRFLGLFAAFFLARWLVPIERRPQDIRDAKP